MSTFTGQVLSVGPEKPEYLSNEESNFSGFDLGLNGDKDNMFPDVNNFLGIELINKEIIDDSFLLGIGFELGGEKPDSFPDDSYLEGFVFGLNGDRDNLFPDENELSGLVFTGNIIKEFITF